MSLSLSPKICVFIVLISILSCRNEKQERHENDASRLATDSTEVVNAEPAPRRPDFILGDLDGDQVQDSIIIISDPVTKKEGLRIVYANKHVDTLGMGKEVLGQGFDDLSWMDLFEKAPKGEKYANNVDENGEILSMDEIPESDWITLPNDGIDIHVAEGCGGGIIYLQNGQYKWIQQE